MSNITDWGNSAADNITAPPDGFPEGMAPGMVNDSCRELMAAVRRFCEDGGWFDWGHTYTWTSGTTFTVPGNLSTTYHIGRRVRAVGTETGTIYGTITDSVYDTLTTVTVAWDIGSMENEAITISLGYLSASGTASTGVDLTNAQTIGGVKTFTSFPITPSSAPTTDYQVANKKFVDDSITGAPALSPVITRVVKTAGYALVASDKGKEIACTGEWTLTLLPAATAGSGFYFWLRNNDTRIITIKGSGSELIWHLATGANTVNIYSYYAVLLQCNGTDWHVLGSQGMGTPGQIRTIGGSTSHLVALPGYFLCNGQEYDKTTYSGLYSIIGTVFGAGSGNNFKVPNLTSATPNTYYVIKY